LITSEEQHKGAAEDALESILMSTLIPIDNIGMVLWRRRRLLAILTGIGLLLAVGYAFSIPNEYISTTQLMPPDQKSLSNNSMLDALTGAGAGPIVTGGGGLLNSRTPGAIFIGILKSRTAEDDLIDRFDLRRIYHCELYLDARNTLAARTTIKENPDNGIISIAVMDRDRYRARDLGEAYVEELNKLINTVSTSSARRERTFLEERLKSLKSDLDVTSIKLSRFSSRNATLNPQSQGQALFASATSLQMELAKAQSELSGLKAIYGDDNVRIRELRARINELQSQLWKMGSIEKETNGADLKADQLYPSIRELPLLGVTYSDLSRQLNMQEAIYETLTKQYELAKVAEAKEIPAIKLLDRPELAEKKSLPHRMTIVVFGTLISAFVGITWIFFNRLWKTTDDLRPVKELVMNRWNSIRGRDAAKPRKY
jgi:uncharacterized protein involved in exopolysaccharide biosynthesis